RISVDDFGTGYSSLSYLRRLPISSLKIDRSFVADIGVDPDDDAIVRTIIALGKALRLEEIAEGIETEAQAEFLTRHGCNLGQGYLFARPMAAEDFATWMKGRIKMAEAAIL
ncbi:MAG: EAL domain-containing protein, partial [Rhodospirillaceae bacterium]